MLVCEPVCMCVCVCVCLCGVCVCVCALSFALYQVPVDRVVYFIEAFLDLFNKKGVRADPQVY